MGYANGRIPATALRTVGGVPLLSSAAAGFRLWQHMAQLEGVTVAVARPLYGSGYRDLGTQQTYWNATHGDPAAAARAGINPNLAVRVATPGYSSHGWGTRVDVTWDGRTEPFTVDLQLAARYGWTREFGSADENHMEHDGRTHTPSDADKNRVVCRWLNGRGLTVKSTTDEDGLWPAESKFSLMLQEQGHKDGLYPTPQYRVDGIAGDRTRWLRDHYWEQLWAA